MTGFGALSVQQLKGDPLRLRGKLIAFVRVSAGIDGGGDEQNETIRALMRNGILAVTADYVEQRSIRDFFKKEFGISLEKGIQEIIDQAKTSGGLEGALDPEAVKERLESMKHADLIPIPAKVAFFNSEEEMLSQDADVFFLGKFSVVSHAHLCVNSFPILYQAYYREQEHREVEAEIGALLGTIEGGDLADPTKAEKDSPPRKNFEGDWRNHLLKNLIPELFYTKGDAVAHAKALDHFQGFMEEFGFPEDIQAMIRLIEDAHASDSGTLKRLELLVDKIHALQAEDYEKLEAIKKALGEN